MLFSGKWLPSLGWIQTPSADADADDEPDAPEPEDVCGVRVVCAVEF